MRLHLLLALVLLAPARAVADARTLREVKKAIAQLRSKDAAVRARGAYELGRRGAAAKIAVPHLAKALGDRSWDVAYSAEKALKRIGSAGVPGLVKALKDRRPGVRVRICEVLKDKALIGFLEPHAKQLSVVLKDSDARVRDAGVALFSAMGSRGLDGLLYTLASSKPFARRAAVEALGTAGLHSVRRLCDALKKSGSATVREGICIALGRMGKKAAKAAPALAQALRDPKEGVRAEAARAIGKTGEFYDRVHPLLFAGLAAESARTREGCIDGLAAYGADAVDALAKRVCSERAVERASAAETLYRIGEPAVPALQEMLKSGAPPERLAAIEILVRFRAWTPSRKDTLEGLCASLRAEDPAVRRAAAAALGQLGRSEVIERKGSTATVDALLVAAADKEAEVRAAALASLGRLGSARASDVLAKALEDGDAAVSMAAHGGRWGIGEDAAAALAGLRAGLKDPAARAAAAGALRRLGPAAEPAIPELAELLGDEAPETRRAAAQALGAIVRPGRFDVKSLRGSWRTKAPRPVRTAIERGLRWLAENQDSGGGFWDSDKHGGGALFDVGVTGLALWAFLGAGEAGRDGPHAATVRRGLDYLLRRQNADGVIGDRSSHEFLTCHAIGAIALTEAWILTGDPRHARAIQASVEFVEAARNPGLAWRYEPRGGENDTHVTTWMVTLLRLADLGGFEVDAAAYAGAARWIDRVTDPNFGQIGYNYPGGASARPERKQDAFPPEKTQAMTAAGTWCRQLLGGALLADPAYRKSIQLCVEIPPSWSREYRDLYYFHFGTLVLFQDGGKAWKKWEAALHRAILPAQSSDGSWPASGVWGADGGRVYSTATMVLSLLVPYRYPPRFATEPSLSRPARAAVKALKRAAKDDDPSVRAAAEHALRQLAPRD